jgi:hypothetical protein
MSETGIGLKDQAPSGNEIIIPTWNFDAAPHVRSPTDDTLRDRPLTSDDPIIPLYMEENVAPSINFTFKPKGFISLDMQVKLNGWRQRYFGILGQYHGPRKSILKPAREHDLVYQYVPTNEEVVGSQTDPRELLPKGTTVANATVFIATNSPLLLQQPYTYLQSLYMIRAQNPAAWLAAILDIHANPNGMALDRMTRINAFGPTAIPSFNSTAESVLDSGIALDKEQFGVMSHVSLAAAEDAKPSTYLEYDRSSVSRVKSISEPQLNRDDCHEKSTMNLLISTKAMRGVAGSEPGMAASTHYRDPPCFMQRRVRFASTMITSVAIIKSSNKGRRVKRKSDGKTSDPSHQQRNGAGTNADAICNIGSATTLGSEESEKFDFSPLTSNMQTLRTWIIQGQPNTNNSADGTSSQLSLSDSHCSPCEAPRKLINITEKIRSSFRGFNI